ncbi:hypothetical protein OA2633_08234 [Oceanicaulis sp. HTCC2633]|uniref:DUF2855 family protein n=1 Tax=Oceanicaulis sp. HTCC2633 TaxID=314254 RepID=UPI000066A14D|nr:DUF2855 family protein [Oceanicaulis sp. HTCC2633]EAP90187.1 hypothetical protein OA2633_08234 [Oceanicaulis sp. HTCC2633]
MGWALSINKADISDARLVRAEPQTLADGQARFAIRRFALTANNITYAAFGAAMRYWDFYPAEDGSGRLPVWGFAEVVESRAPGLEAGERVYGYWPAADEAVLTVDGVKPGSFLEVSPHRAELAGAYNRYVRCQADPGYAPEREAAQMVLQPLFITSFLIDLHLRDHDFMGASQITLTSASSKTALALAHLLHANPPEGVKIEALTSARNAGFVKSTGYYDVISTYDEINGFKPEPRRLIVDFAGDSKVNKAIHETLGDDLVGNIRVGGAHWENSAPPGVMPGPKPVFFFAPDHVRDRMKAWGSEEFGRRYGAAWMSFVEAGQTLFSEEEFVGGEGALKAYDKLIAGNFDAASAMTVKAG